MEVFEMNNKVILTTPLRLMTPIIKVVGDFCNLRCRYCFHSNSDQSTPHVMNDELLEKFIKEYMELFTGRLVFIWHGGEPLLAGLNFFKKVLGLQNRYLKNGQKIDNRIQTNATLINDKWAVLFKENDFKVGISLDGNKDSHNYFRKDSKGRGSFELTMRGIEILKQYDIDIQHAFLQVLTKDNLKRVKENFDFFVNTLMVKSWGICHYLDLEKTNRNMVNQNITNKQFFKFLKDLIDLWLTQDKSDLAIREIENFLFGIKGKMAKNCSFNGTCTSFFCLEWDGRIYPCDRSSGQDNLFFGDFSKQSLLEILNDTPRLKYAEMVNSLPSDCVACEWQNACHNGCPSHRIGGIGGKYYYCETRKKIFVYLKTKIKRL